MEPTFFAQYHGFEFHCSPERLGERQFVPRLVIHDANEATSIEVPIEVSTYSDATVAAHRAFAYGRRWVDGGFDATVAGSTRRLALLEG